LGGTGADCWAFAATASAQQNREARKRSLIVGMGPAYYPTQ
jgi:hypothetical protein